MTQRHSARFVVVCVRVAWPHSLAVHAQAPSPVPTATPLPVAATLHADQPGAVVNRNIYGHFAEHLGRCIYEGIWVGEDSPIPNTRGIRNDVVAALKAAQDARCCAGRAAASPTSITGRTASARARSARR